MLYKCCGKHCTIGGNLKKKEKNKQNKSKLVIYTTIHSESCISTKVSRARIERKFHNANYYLT